MVAGRSSRFPWWAAVWLLWAWGPSPLPVRAAGGTLELSVIDAASGEPLAVRVHLRNHLGRAARVPRAVAWGDHFVMDGRLVLDLPVGRYQFEMERGLEYRLRTGEFTIERGANDHKQVELPRFVDMRNEGWWSGDLHVQRSPREMQLLMLAEDLHVAPVVPRDDASPARPGAGPPAEPLVRLSADRWYDLRAARDARDGGPLLYFQLPQPLPLPPAGQVEPLPVQWLVQTRREPPPHVDLPHPFCADLPMWIASGRVHSIGILHDHLLRGGVTDHEAGGRARDKLRYPAPHGNGRWSQDIYYQLLNCGLRLPPSAGSGSGLGANPVGYNRVYVHCGQEFNYEKWWAGLRAGRVVVTNGPLLRPRVNGRLPGYVFRGYAGEPLELSVELKLSTRDPIAYLEIIKNGRSEREVRLDEWAAAGGTLPPITFTESGWLLVRAVAATEHTYRYATSGPFYVQCGDQPRISKAAAQFFADWAGDRLRQAELDSTASRGQLLRYQRAAAAFWQRRVEQANAE